MQSNLPYLEVCLSPSLLHQFDATNKIVVVVDIFRASSAIVTALGEGISAVIPIKTIEEAKDYQRKNYIVAAERNGQIVPDFKLGNSPLHYKNIDLIGEEIVFTSTNFTSVIKEFSFAKEVLVASFLNMSAIKDYVLSLQLDVLIVCSGYKGKINIEDSLFAGFLALSLENDYQIHCDSATLAIQGARHVPSKEKWSYLKKSSHKNRLESLNITDDLMFCLQEDIYTIVPIYSNGIIIPAEQVLQD